MEIEDYALVPRVTGLYPGGAEGREILFFNADLIVFGMRHQFPEHVLAAPGGFQGAARQQRTRKRKLGPDEFSADCHVKSFLSGCAQPVCARTKKARHPNSGGLSFILHAAWRKFC